MESVTTKKKETWKTGILLVFLILCFNGCSTPLFSTDNKYLLWIPGAERRSDEIEGILRPWERAKLIQEKGEKGRKCNEEEKEILILQLINEYQNSSDPYIRRTSIDALGKIVSNYPCNTAESILMTALYDSTLNIRLSACNAIGKYCTEGKAARQYPERRKWAAETLYSCYRKLPYSLEPGDKRENDERKDLRLAILRQMSLFTFEDSPAVLQTLEEGLNGEKLDDGALQTASMQSLQKMTGKHYGLNAEIWLDYVQFLQGKRTEAPKEQAFFERMTRPDLPLFK